MHKFLVLGGSGLVGKAIFHEMNQYHNFETYLTYFNHPVPWAQNRSFKFNVEEPDTICDLLNSIKPDGIVSCLRGDFSRQLRVHLKIAKYMKQDGGNLYFFSTANVFDNDYSKPHDEEDLPNSRTDYGQYKIECENKLKEILHDQVCILRIPQVWGIHSPRMKQLQELMNNNENIVVYPKLFHTANTDVMIARQVGYIINNHLSGTFHLTSEDVANYKEFYNQLLTGLGFHTAKIQDNIEEEGYFALLSKRHNEFPIELRYTNQSVIDYLIHPI